MCVCVCVCVCVRARARTRTVAQSYLTLCNPVDYSLPGSSAHGILQAYWRRLPSLSPEDLPYPGIKPSSSALQVDSLLSELPGMPKYMNKYN